jgi:hypothetical protein
LRAMNDNCLRSNGELKHVGSRWPRTGRCSVCSREMPESNESPRPYKDFLTITSLAG